MVGSFFCLAPQHSAPGSGCPGIRPGPQLYPAVTHADWLRTFHFHT